VHRPPREEFERRDSLDRTAQLARGGSSRSRSPAEPRDEPPPADRPRSHRNTEAGREQAADDRGGSRSRHRLASSSKAPKPAAGEPQREERRSTRAEQQAAGSRRAGEDEKEAARNDEHRRSKHAAGEHAGREGRQQRAPEELPKAERQREAKPASKATRSRVQDGSKHADRRAASAELPGPPPLPEWRGAAAAEAAGDHPPEIMMERGAERREDHDERQPPPPPPVRRVVWTEPAPDDSSAAPARRVELAADGGRERGGAAPEGQANHKQQREPEQAPPQPAAGTKRPRGEESPARKASADAAELHPASTKRRMEHEANGAVHARHAERRESGRQRPPQQPDSRQPRAPATPLPGARDARGSARNENGHASSARQRIPAPTAAKGKASNKSSRWAGCLVCPLAPYVLYCALSHWGIMVAY
jgi:hypothetical protein